MLGSFFALIVNIVLLSLCFVFMIICVRDRCRVHCSHLWLRTGSHFSFSRVNNDCTSGEEPWPRPPRLPVSSVVTIGRCGWLLKMMQQSKIAKRRKIRGATSSFVRSRIFSLYCYILQSIIRDDTASERQSKVLSSHQEVRSVTYRPPWASLRPPNRWLRSLLDEKILDIPEQSATTIGVTGASFSNAGVPSTTSSCHCAF